MYYGRVLGEGSPEHYQHDLMEANDLTRLDASGNVIEKESDEDILKGAINPDQSDRLVEINPFSENYSWNLDTGEFQAPGNETESPIARRLQIMGNNASHGLQGSPGEDGRFQNTFNVTGLFNQETIDSIIQLRRDLGFENAEYNPIESG